VKTEASIDDVSVAADISLDRISDADELLDLVGDEEVDDSLDDGNSGGSAPPKQQQQQPLPPSSLASTAMATVFAPVSTPRPQSPTIGNDPTGQKRKEDDGKQSTASAKKDDRSLDSEGISVSIDDLDDLDDDFDSGYLPSFGGAPSSASTPTASTSKSSDLSRLLGLSGFGKPK
jgi:hypothetical protein